MERSKPAGNIDRQGQEVKTGPYADELLRLYRQRSGLTQRQLAFKLGFSSDRMVKKWEGSFNLPEPQRLRSLIELYQELGVFTRGQEFPEASKLWAAIKGAFETENAGLKTRSYPIFDANWFNGLEYPKTNAKTKSLNPSRNSLNENKIAQNEHHHNLPVAMNSFVGRKSELKEIERLLQNNQILTLTGTGGVGKTRLALQLAGKVKENYKDGVWLVELAALTSSEQINRAVAGLFGVKETAGQPLITGLAMYLKSKDLLLILDNCEHLVDSCAELVYTLASRCSSLKILATSRERLRVDAETVWRVPPLSLPAPALEQFQTGQPRGQDQSFPVLTSDAVELLLDRVRAFNPEFNLDSQNAVFANELCQQLEGLPLAIELAAARTRVLSIEQINARLWERFELLTGGDRSALPRQQTLRALIDWSYELLSSNEQKLLARLAVFVGGFTLEAVEAVCKGGGIEVEEVLGLISELVTRSLVSARRSGTAMRYNLLETIRLYGQERMVKSGEELVLRNNHLQYYLDFAARHEAGLNSGKQKENGEIVGRDYLNCQSALNYAINRQETTLALQMCRKLYVFWDLRSYFSEGKIFLTRSLALPGPAGTLEQGYASNDLAYLYESLSDYEMGITYASRGLEIGRKTGDNRIITSSLYLLGNMNMWLGNDQEAHKFYNQALELYIQMNDKAGISRTYAGLGQLVTYQSDYPNAIKWFSASLALDRESGDDQSAAIDLCGLGIISVYQGKYVQALKYHEESIALARGVGYRTLVASNLTNLGIAYFHKGDYEKALEYYQESLTLHKDLGNIAHASNVLINLGELARIQGDYVAARDYSLEALELKEEMGDKWEKATCFNNLGNIAGNQGDYELARSYCQASLTLRQELDTKRGIASCCNNLGGIALLESEYETSEQYYRQALAIRRSIGDLSGITETLIYLGLLGACMNNLGLARAFLQEVFQESLEEQSHLTLACLFATLAVTFSLNPGKEKESAFLVMVTEILLAGSKVVLEQTFLRPFLEVKAKLEKASFYPPPADSDESRKEPATAELIRAALALGSERIVLS